MENMHEGQSTSRWLTAAGAMLVCGLLVAGCASGVVETTRSYPSSEAAGLYHDWKAIYRIEQQGTKRKLHHEGFLDHQFLLDDRDGRYVVFDREHRERGFILPESGKAFAYERNPKGELNITEVAQLGLEKGIQRLLGLSGEIVLEAVSEGGMPATSAQSD
jgi:hypothetical protein